MKIPVYEGRGKFEYYIDSKDIKWENDAHYGGTWIGKERLLGIYEKGDTKLAVVTDGNEKYAYSFEEFKNS